MYFPAANQLTVNIPKVFNSCLYPRGTLAMAASLPMRSLIWMGMPVLFVLFLWQHMQSGAGKGENVERKNVPPQTNIYIYFCFITETASFGWPITSIQNSMTVTALSVSCITSLKSLSSWLNILGLSNISVPTWQKLLFIYICSQVITHLIMTLNLQVVTTRNLSRLWWTHCTFVSVQ
jgi:hypothetical protein